MAQFRPGSATTMVTGVVSAAGPAFKMLARSAVLDAGSRVFDLTSEADVKTALYTNELITGTLRLVGWIASGTATVITNLGTTVLEKVDLTIIPFASVAGERIVVECTAERVRVGYTKIEGGVACAITLRVSNLTAGA